MPCCGEKRAALTIARTTDPPTAPTESRHPPARDTTAEPGRQPGIRLRYLGVGPMALTGPRTGRAYWWPTATAATVALADVDALLRTRLFAIDGEPGEPAGAPGDSAD